ncbi:MAG: hypothetical protein H7343_11410 [Undibacterium sp.]|nr:hypothetical protein [Opitutaceae bacterium]
MPPTYPSAITPDSMLFELTALLLLVGMTTVGLAWPLATRLALAPAEKFVVSAILSLLGVFLLGWLTYAAALPATTLWLAPVLAVSGLFFNRRSLAATILDPTVRALLLAQLLVTAWCLGWLSLVASYSGGGWAADWFEHWERARFFLEHGPLDQRFLGSYALPARPPLANIVTATFLALTHIDFAHYQIISTFLASLAFLPAALLARRFHLRPGFDGPPARPETSALVIALLAVFFAVNPLFVQNATFAWTKLPAAACVLLAFYFFLRAHDPAPPRAAPVLFAVSLATALLAHYSAGPAAVVLSSAWLFLGWSRRRDAAWWRSTLTAALVGALILAPWFAWSLAHYGAAGTFLSNSSVQSPDARSGNQLLKILLNLRDTLVPHFLRPLDDALITQRNSWGAARDFFFQLYQLNLPLAFGSVAVFALAREACRAARTNSPAGRRGWTLALAALVLLSVAVQGERDHWGLTQICLQSLVLLGLAFLAARWPILTRRWRLALIIGATFDFLAGIALHFAAQNFALDRWFAPAGTDPAATYTGYNAAALMNLAAKLQHHLTFVADRSPQPPTVIFVNLTALLVFLITRVRIAARSAPPPPR